MPPPLPGFPVCYGGPGGGEIHRHIGDAIKRFSALPHAPHARSALMPPTEIVVVGMLLQATSYPAFLSASFTTAASRGFISSNCRLSLVQIHLDILNPFDCTQRFGYCRDTMIAGHAFDLDGCHTIFPFRGLMSAGKKFTIHRIV